MNIICTILHLSKWVLHNIFDQTAIDIGMFQLISPLNYTNHIQPVCLTTDDSNLVVEPNSAWTTGWGSINYVQDSGGVLAYNLRQTHVPLVRSSSCSAIYSSIQHIDDEIMVCAGTHEVGICVVSEIVAIFKTYLIGRFGWTTRCADERFLVLNRSHVISHVWSRWWTLLWTRYCFCFFSIFESYL